MKEKKLQLKLIKLMILIGAFIPMGSEIEKEVMKRLVFDLQQESSKPVEEEIVQQDDVIAEQALEDDTEKEELQVYLNIVLEDESLNVESLATKYPIVDWETQILANDKYYYQIKRANGSVKHYKIFSVMLYDFDRQDVLELYNLVKERFQTASLEVHVLLMDTGFVIHMMVEKKYPLSQDILSKILSRKLEVDHQSDMGYELIRGGLLGINLHKLVLLVQELNTAQNITTSTNWVSTARRKVSTASTELNTAGRLCTAA
ncbi:hypothetical protein Tco_0065477 [Tanacetum coccineum]